MVRLLSLSDALQALSDTMDVEHESKQVEKDDELVGVDSLRRAARSVREMRGAQSH